jgi:hypothetical protein
MRIGFIIQRAGTFKNLGGVIDEAMRRGHTAVLLIDRRDTYKRDLAAPDIHGIPKFLYGIPDVTHYDGIPSLADTVKGKIDCLAQAGWVFSNWKMLSNDENSPCCQLQKIRSYGIPVIALCTYFYDHCLMELDAFQSVDHLCLTSPASVAMHKQILLECKDASGAIREEYKNEIEKIFEQHATITGSPGFDPFLKLYTERKTENRSDVILFVPKLDQLPYSKIMLRKHPRLVSTAYSLFKYNGRYLSSIWTTPRYAEFLHHLEKVANRHQLTIVAKSRPKHGDAYENMIRRMSRQYHTGADDDFYPSYTSCEILKNAAFCLHMRTFSVLESVLAGVPSVHISIPIIEKDDLFPKQMQTYIRVVRTSLPESMFNYEGCVWNVPWKDITRFMNSFSLKDIEVDLKRRAEYISYFCGVSERSASECQMDVLEKYMK